VCAGSALLLAKGESTSVINGALVGVLLSQSASPSVVYLSSPRLTYLGFLTEGKSTAIFITPSSWGFQRAGYLPRIKLSYDLDILGARIKPDPRENLKIFVRELRV
jgi:hypothetical protein